MIITYREYNTNNTVRKEVKKVDFVEMANGEIKTEFIVENKRGGKEYYSIYTNQIISIENKK